MRDPFARPKCSHELRRDDLEQQFNALGTEGYELAWVLMNQNLHGEKDGHVVIFKRPEPATA